MSDQPWFKFYPSDYLLDPKVDSLPLEARAILICMWCLCHIDGFCPVDLNEIARKSRLNSDQISRHVPALLGFFDERDGRLYSPRMEAEKLKSEAARRNGQKRGEQIRSANCSANGSASGLAQSQSQSQSQKQPSPPSKEEVLDFSLQKKKTEFLQPDFDARDRRKLAQALNQIGLQLSASVGAHSQPTEKQVFEWACDRAGISVERGLEVQESGKKWPTGAGASA